MINKDTQNEMELLRKQLEEMKREREAEQATATAKKQTAKDSAVKKRATATAKKRTVKDSAVKKQATSKQTGTAEEADTTSDTTSETATNTSAAADNDTTESTEDIVTQVKVLLESLEKDINDSKPVALLAVFALGVLVGRLAR